MTAILFVSYSGAFGGAERVLLDCAGAVHADARAQAVLACPEGPLAAAARGGGLSVLTIPVRRPDVRGRRRDRVLAPLRLVDHARELRELAGAVQPDAVVAWNMRSAIASLALPARYPLAVGHNDLLPGRLSAAAVRRAVRRAQLVLVPSHAVAEDLGMAGAPVRVVYPGIDLERFAAPWEPADPPEVLVLGALMEWKRPDLALAVLERARRSVPELRLRLLGAPLDGGPTLPDSLRLRASRQGLTDAVVLAGADPRPELALARAACLLHCAPREPFGLAVAEALAAGCPAVVPDAAGPAEIVDESCGRHYPPLDADAAARAVVELVSDRQLARRLGDSGRERARARFDHRRARAKYAEALAPLVGLGRSGRPGGARVRTLADQLALVTVTHNSAAELQALLRSVARHLPGAELVVVDNASSDDSASVARSAGATVIALETNVGFGAACNHGVDAVQAPITALINPDVELLDDSLLSLATELGREGRPERLLAPLVLNDDGSRQDSVHPVPGSAPDLARAVVSPAAVPGGLGAGLWPWRAPGPRQVGWAVACALVARTETLRRLGPFDASLFLYGEDLELGLRAGQAGVPTWFWPAGRVVHHRAHSSERAFGGEPFERLARTRHEVVRRRLGARRARLDDLAQTVTFGSRAAIKTALGRPAERERRQLAAVRSLSTDHGRDGGPA